MNGRIGHLHCNYRVIGSQTEFGNIPTRIDRLLRERLPQAYENALDQALGDDASVYVLRRVQTKLNLLLSSDIGDVRLASNWGERLAGTVMRNIAHALAGDENVVRFQDQADYVTHFMVDLIDGNAWRRWYYGAFKYVKKYPVAEAGYRVLIDNREDLPKVLAQLSRCGKLPHLFRILNKNQRRGLWSSGLRGQRQILKTSSIEQASANDIASLHAPFNEDAFTTTDISSKQPTASTPDQDHQSETESKGKERSLFLLAYRLIDALSMWDGPAPPVQVLYENYHPLIISDWSDGAALTQSVIHMLHYIAADARIKSQGRYLSPDFISRIEMELQAYDWLEIASIRDTLIVLSTASASTQQVSNSRRLTKRQQRLFEQLHSVLEGTYQQREGQGEGQSRQALYNDLDTSSTSLTLYAALMEHDPQWMGDDFAARLIESLTELVPLFQNRPALISLLTAGARSLSEILPSEISKHYRSHLNVLETMGEAGRALLNTALANAMTTDAMQVIQSKCAGPFLLLRALADIRLPQLAKEANYPPVADKDHLWALLMPLFMNWAGEGSIKHGRIDPGVQLLAGPNAEIDLQQLVAVWRPVSVEAHQQFQERLLQILAGQRLISGDSLSIYKVSFSGSEALVAGGVADLHSPLVWPLGRILAEDEETVPVIRAWLRLWQRVFGKVPANLILDDKLRLDQELEAVVADNSDPQWREIHQQGSEALRKALASLQHGHLGVVQADLSLALCAITVLRVWARWLPRFADAGVPYLLENFIRRAGMLSIDDDSLDIELVSAPLNVVIEMAGYTAEIENLSWLGNRNIRFHLGRGV